MPINHSAITVSVARSEAVGQFVEFTYSGLGAGLQFATTRGAATGKEKKTKHD